MPSSKTGSPSAASDGAASWALDALGSLTDLVVALDESLSIVWVNEHTVRLLGYEDAAQALGQSVADFVHPDDLLRAGEVVGMMVEDTLVVPVTPALYRVRRFDGEWMPIELNGTVVRAPDDERELIVIVGRYSGDRHLQDQIVELLTSGSSTDSVVDLIPEFGYWRHPYEVYAIWYRNGSGERVMIGTPLAVELGEAAGPGSPWHLAAERNDDVVLGPDELTPEVRRLAEQHRLGHCWAMPVPDPMHDEPAVVIAWSRAGAGMATPVHRYALETMARALTLVLQWRRHRTGLEDAARRDPLTGVANRARVFELLAQLGADADADADANASEDDGGRDRARLDGKVGLLYIDLDGFKDVNDLNGHAAGDAVLAEVARRIAEVLRPGDLLGRLGGDEFAVVCIDIERDEVLPLIAQRIIDAVSLPMRVGRHEAVVGASIGIATAAAQGLDPDELVDRADQALYDAKTAGRGRWSATTDPR